LFCASVTKETNFVAVALARLKAQQKVLKPTFLFSKVQLEDSRAMRTNTMWSKNRVVALLREQMLSEEMLFPKDPRNHKNP
jgi:hypothetical protein